MDEFLVLKKHHHIVDFLHEYASDQSVGALTVNWYMYRSIDQLIYKPLPVTKRFVYREVHVNQHVNFVNLKKGKSQVDTRGKVLKGPFNPDGPTNVAVLHHYWTKSQKEFIAKKMRGRAGAAGKSAYTEEEAIRMMDPLKNSTLIRTHRFDDSAWQTLKDVAPRYRYFDTLTEWNDTRMTIR